jgi:uncharacterized membrane protein
LNRRAQLAYYGLCATTVVWTASLPLAAYAAGSVPAHIGAYPFALAVYGIGSFVCHQLPERSFHIAGVALPVCARCTGIYLAAALSAIWCSRFTPGLRERGDRPALAVVALFASFVPTAATLVYEWSSHAPAANWVRLAAGLPIGVVVMQLITREWRERVHTKVFV